MRTTLIVAFIAVALTGSASAKARHRPADPDAWRATITDADRGRLRNWRNAWVIGLQQARAAGEGLAIARQDVLLDPDAALENPTLPDGDYDCRTIKLGRKTATGLAYVAYPALPCRIAGGVFRTLAGSQRPNGRFWPLDPLRLIFLGAMALGDEARPLDYGRDTDRDMVGVIERIGPRRWRLVLPQPEWESQIDVIELVPKAGTGAP